MTTKPEAMSKKPVPPKTFDRWWVVGLVVVTMILEVWLPIIVTSPGEKDRFTLALVAAAATPLVLLVLLLHLRRVFLLIPLLVLIPVVFLSVQLFEWLFLFALLVYFLREVPGSRFGFRPGAFDAAFAVYIVWAALSVPRGEDLRYAVVGFTTVVIFFLAYLAGSRILGLSRFPALLQVYSVISIGVALETLGVFLFRFHGQGPLTAQLGSTTDLGWGRSNYVAAVAALVSAAGIPAIVLETGRIRRLAVLALLAALFVSFASASRGGTLALVIAVVLGLSLSRLNLRWALAILAGLVGILTLSPLGQTVLAEWIATKGLPSIGARLLFYRETLAIIAAHPLFGIGPDQIPFHTYILIGTNPHNVLLKQAADYGLVGLTLYLIILGLLLRRMISLLHSATGGWERLRAHSFFLVLVVALVNSSYEPALVGPQYGFLFWFMMGVLCAAPDGAEGKRP